MNEISDHLVNDANRPENSPCKNCLSWKGEGTLSRPYELDYSAFRPIPMLQALGDYRAMVKHLQGSMVGIEMRAPFREEITKQDHIMHAIIGIADEAGELIEILKAQLWYGKPFDKQHILEELGDTFHYMMYLMIEYDWTLEDIMGANTEKLAKRYPDGFTTEDALKRMDKEAKEEAVVGTQDDAVAAAFQETKKVCTKCRGMKQVFVAKPGYTKIGWMEACPECQRKDGQV